MYIRGSLLLCWEDVVPSSLEDLYCRVASARKTFTYAKEKLSVNIVRRLSLPLRVQSVLTEVNATPALGLPHCCVNSVVDTATFDNVFRLLCILSLYVCTHYLLVCVSSSFYQWNISRHHISISVLFFTQNVHNGGGSGGMQCVPLLESHINFEKLAMGGCHEALNTWQDTRKCIWHGVSQPWSSKPGWILALLDLWQYSSCWQSEQYSLWRERAV